MADTQSWNAGYRACGESSGYQLTTNLSGCSMSNPYLRRYCHDCNPNCTRRLGLLSEVDQWATLSPCDPALPVVLSNIGGLQWNVAGHAADVETMSDEVTLVWDNRATYPPGNQSPVAVKPNDIFPEMREMGRPRRTTIPDIRRRLGLASDTRLWLAPGAFDNVIEWMWYYKQFVLDTVEANRFDTLVSPDFSVYGTQCPLQWRISGKRSLIMYEEFSHVCTSPVVTISVPNSFFAEQWAGWFRKNSEVNAVCINAQLWIDDRLFDCMFRLVESFRDMVGRDLHYVIAGPTAEQRIERVRAAFPRSTILSSLWYNRGSLDSAA